MTGATGATGPAAGTAVALSSYPPTALRMNDGLHTHDEYTIAVAHFGPPPTIAVSHVPGATPDVVLLAAACALYVAGRISAFLFAALVRSLRLA